jgi:ketosteroid isomerase-like protein
MSKENVEAVRGAIEAFNEEGVEAALEYLDPEVEWLAPPDWLEKHLYKGHEGVREIASMWSEAFEEYRLDLKELIDCGDDVVVLIHQRGRIRGSPETVEHEIAYVWSIENEKGVRVQVYFSWDEALRHARLA